MTFITPPVGINRGYLFGVGQEPYKDHVYVTDPNYPLDPFTNPKLCQAFDNAQVIVSEFEDVSNEQELSEFFQTLPERLQKSLAPSDLQKFKQTLEPILDRLPGLKKCQAYEKLKTHIKTGENDAAIATTLALFGILHSITTMRKQVEELSPQRPLPETNTKQRLLDRVTLQSKQIVPLLLQLDVGKKVTEAFSLLMQEPELLRAILFALTDPEVMALIFDANTFERGSYDEQCTIPDLSKEKLLRVLFFNAEIDVEKLMTSPVIAQLDTLFSIPHISEKIARFVRNDKRHLLFVSSHTLEKWPRLDFPLTQIKVPLKPVGFCWTIRDDDGHEGILMGSMHITAEKLVNFPTRIIELFDTSDAVAVEIDVTREDIVKRCSEEVSWEKTQAKELELLSIEEKEALFQFLKGQYPDLEVTFSDNFDLQTQFLIQALKKEALQGFKVHISDQKDEVTNQSFFSTGIEETLIRRAKEKQIPIRDLETFKDHFIKFSSGSSSLIPNVPCEQMKKMIEMSKSSLEEVLDIYCSHSDMPKTQDELFEWLQKDPLQKMTDAMESGNLDALNVSYLMDYDPLSQAKLIERNRNMATKIDEFMKSGKKHFCIAGAMHMAGPSSIPAFLKQAGYEVKRLIVEEPLEPSVF